MAYDKPQQKDPNFIFRLERNIKAYMLYTIIALMLVCIGLCVALIVMMPLKEKQPFLLTFSDAETNFVSIQAAGKNISQDQAMLKSILAGYVKRRETINRIDDVERYNIIRTQSKKYVWDAFSQLVSQPNSIYTTQQLQRSIKIINVAILSTTVATVDFQAEISNQARSNVTFKKYRAALEFGFEPKDTNYAQAIENPTGFVVKKYAITEIIEKDNK